MKIESTDTKIHEEVLEIIALYAVLNVTANQTIIIINMIIRNTAFLNTKNIL